MAESPPPALWPSRRGLHGRAAALAWPCPRWTQCGPELAEPGQTAAATACAVVPVPSGWLQGWGGLSTVAPSLPSSNFSRSSRQRSADRLVVSASPLGRGAAKRRTSGLSWRTALHPRELSWGARGGGPQETRGPVRRAALLAESCPGLRHGCAQGQGGCTEERPGGMGGGWGAGQSRDLTRRKQGLMNFQHSRQ